MTDFVDRFDTVYLPKLGIRSPTFRAVIREAVHRKVGSIVETGTMRKVDNWEGDGQSTIIWADYAKWATVSFQTIDIDQEAIELARQTCPNAGCVVGDSITKLSNDKNAIDLLYLDSFDVDMANAGPAAMHCLFEFCAARPRLHPGSIVFVDDSPMGPDGVGGKGAFVFNYFKHLGIMPFTWGYQVAWIMP